MAASSNLLPALTAYLRRKFASDVNGLKRLADQAFAEIGDTVTITSQAFADASTSGEVTYPKEVLLQAIETVIAELDSSARRGSNAAVVYFR